MSVDKFGRYSKQKYNTNILKKNVPRIVGIIVDSDNNLNVQNKRIKNLGVPRDDTDAINKGYLQAEINRTQDQLKRGLNTEVVSIKNNIKELKSIINDIYYTMTEHNSKMIKK